MCNYFIRSNPGDEVQVDKYLKLRWISGLQLKPSLLDGGPPATIPSIVRAHLSNRRRRYTVHSFALNGYGDCPLYLLVQPYQYQRYAGLLDQSFRLRKRVFHDRLGWQVDVDHDLERDVYDDLGAVYLLWCDDDARSLYGTLRLMPTTGPTLLHDVFARTFPNTDLVAPSIWEGTRMCLDAELLKKVAPTLSPSRAFGFLLLALCECSIAHGIETLVSNYEPQMGRVYRRAGLMVEEIGRAEGYGRFPVCCGIFDVCEETRQRMQTALRVTRPLYTAFSPERSNVAAMPVF